MKTIALTQGKLAIVDDEDYQVLNRYKWCAHKQYATWYAVRGQRQRGKVVMIYMHREILKPPANMGTDHINHDGLNNQKKNLRLATKSQNGQNQKPRKGTSNFKGVCWHQCRKKWRADIQVRGKRIFLGLFLSEVEAAKAYDAAARKYFGEYAQSNFVD